MLHDFDITFLPGDQIEVMDKESDSSAVFQYYDDDPELYMVSFHYRKVGMPFGLLEEFFTAAEDEILIEQHCSEEGGPDPASRFMRDLAELKKQDPEGRIKTQEEAFEFFHDRDVKVLDESPADFFLPLDMNEMLPHSEEEFTGAQFYQPFVKMEKQIPKALKKQVEALYKTEYSFRVGYPILLLKAPHDKFAQSLLAYYPNSPSGILFLDRDHIYGIIQFSGLKKYFATEWNRQRGRRFPLYCNEFGKMLLVQKFGLNKKGELVNPNSQEWYSFFNIGPNLVIRQYQEFKKAAEAGRRIR